VRIILGKLRLGFSDMTIVDALSWMISGNKTLRGIIEDAYNICADIGLIAHTLKEKGIDALKDMHAQVGIPIRPAAAERLPTAADIVEKIGPCVAQPKLDGFRLQIHIDKRKEKPVIKFFSRHLQDMSAMFPDLTKAVSELPVQTCICEGEAIVFNADTGSFLPFQETVKRKRKHGIEQAMSDLPLQIFLFDLLYLNGSDLLDEPHEKRRDTLIDIVKKIKSEVVRVDAEVPIHTAGQLEAYFNEAISAGLEGLVVKRPQAPYQPGKRGFNWIKLKRIEGGQLEDTVDAVILGYYAGEGKRVHFGIGAFLVGVYNKKEDRFETIAKVGTGLKDEDWKELRKKCDAIAVSAQPKNVVCASELHPDVWVNPELVCAIFADEITLSPLHSAAKTEKQLGYALRFPRFMGYRSDKGPEEATTIDEIAHLYKDQFPSAGSGRK
jgi:DNA ligase-1